MDRFLNPETRLLARTPIQLFDLDDSKYLALTLPFYLDENADLKESEHSNIYLIDLKQKRLVFTIYGAELLLDISLAEGSTKPTRKCVTYLSSTTDIVKDEWD